MIRYLIGLVVSVVVCVTYAATRRKHKRDIIRYSAKALFYFLATIIGLGVASYIICRLR